MLESIAKNIATAIFIVCAMIVNSLFAKSEPDKTSFDANITKSDAVPTYYSDIHYRNNYSKSTE